jgi:hypothetical protein
VTAFVWADPEAGANEMIKFAGTDLDAVRDYASKWGSGYPNAAIYQLVEIPVDGGCRFVPPEPAGWKLTCGGCGKTEWITPADITSFKFYRGFVGDRPCWWGLCECGTANEVTFQ